VLQLLFLLDFFPKVSKVNPAPLINYELEIKLNYVPCLSSQLFELLISSKIIFRIPLVSPFLFKAKMAAESDPVNNG